MARAHATALAVLGTLSAAVIMSALADPATTGMPPVGALQQLAGKRGCLRDGGGKGCTPARAVSDEAGLAVAPDGHHLYAATWASDLSRIGRIGVLRRGARTGALRQIAGHAGCLREGGGSGCGAARGINGIRQLALSPDGRNLYATGNAGVAIFRRNRRTGALTQLNGSAGCLRGEPPEEDADHDCAPVRGLRGAADPIALSPDGRNVYVGTAGSRHSGLAIFRRNRADGALRQLPGDGGCLGRSRARGCAHSAQLDEVDAIAVSPDGRNVYVNASEAVVVLARTAASGAVRQLGGTRGCLTEPDGARACARPRNLPGSIFFAIAISADGRNAYVDRLDGLAVFRRDAASGVLTPLGGRAGCLSTARACTPTKAINGARGIALSADGRSGYVTTSDSVDGLVVLARDPGTGGLNEVPGPAGCIARLRGCTRPRFAEAPHAVVLSPDGRNLYGNDEGGGELSVFARQVSSSRSR